MLRNTGILLLIAALLPSTVRADCYVAGHACGGATATTCCAGLTCQQQPGTTVKTCAPGISTTVLTTTSTSPTTVVGQMTTTTSSGPTTSTIFVVPLPSAPEYSFIYSPADFGALLTGKAGLDTFGFSVGCQFTGAILDPRDGQPANQMLLAAMGWQYEAYSMELVALADAAGCPVNEVQIEDANFKFGGDYVLEHSAFPSGGTYQWMQPTYVRQYTCAPIVAVARCLASKGMLPPDLAQVAGLDTSGHISAPPAAYNMNPEVTAGMLHYTPGFYPPLTAQQCAALQAADEAHTAHDNALLGHDFQAAADNNQAVFEAQRAFEGTALDINQATLFKWVWQGNYNRANPQDVLDGLTRQIIDAHHHVAMAYNCATGASPDVARIIHYELKHNFLHDCRATTHWLDQPMQTVCDGSQIQSCPRLTCREQAQQ